MVLRDGVDAGDVGPGDGYRYLLASVAAGDGQRDLSAPLTRYYAEAGCPPGTWLGSGLRGLGFGQLRAGDTVAESQLALLLVTGHDPVTGEWLGHSYPSSRSSRPVHRRTGGSLDPDLSEGDRVAAIAAIECEGSRPVRREVAG